MSERPTHVVLTSLPDGMHYVAIRRGEWFQAVAAFFDLDRAEQYCEVENDMSADGEFRDDLAETPDTPAPQSNVRAERFIRAEPISAEPTVRKDRTVEPEPVVAKIATTESEPAEQAEPPEDDPEDDAPLADAEAPDAPWVEEEPKPNGSKLPGQPFRRKGEEAPRLKPLTSGWSTERDPNLVREPETKASVEMPKGSQAQRLADRIEADLPELMKLHFNGPISPDLVSRYGEKEARVRDAMLYLVKSRKARFYLPDGEREGHLVPVGFEGPATRQGRPKEVDQASRRDAVIRVLKDASEDGVVEMSMSAIARRSDVPLGSITPLMKELTESGALELVRKADTKAKRPAAYRVTA